jgi:hypothetical protein
MPFHFLFLLLNFLRFCELFSLLNGSFGGLPVCISPGMKRQLAPKGLLPNDRMDVNKIFVGHELILKLISERTSFPATIGPTNVLALCAAFAWVKVQSADGSPSTPKTA